MMELQPSRSAHKDKERIMKDTAVSLPSKPSGLGFLPLLNRVIAVVTAWAANARTRRHLAELTDQQLADIGVSRSERMEELEKPFWR